MKMPFLLISPKIVPKIQLIKKGGCFEYHAVIADKIKYRYVHRASICPALGMDRRSFFMPKPMGKYKRLEVFYLSKPVYTADKPSDCHYCYFWTNGRKGCRLGRNNCYYLISLPPKPKSECDGCPYGRDHPCIGWCTKKVMREVGLRWYGCVWTGIPLLLFCPMSLRKDGYDFPQHSADNRKFSAERRWWSRVSFDYFYGQQSDLFTFYRVPKVLFTNERFWNISADAKMLYGILLDRMSLSARNGWICS